MQQAHRPDRAGRHPGAGFAHQRVEAIDEGHRRDAPGCVGGSHEAAGGGGVDGQGLLADHVLARGQGRGRQVGVQVVGRAHVDDVDVGARGEDLGLVERVLGTEAAGRGPSPLGGRGGHADQAGPGATHGAGVDLADEAGPHDGGAQGALGVVGLVSAVGQCAGRLPHSCDLGHTLMPTVNQKFADMRT